MSVHPTSHAVAVAPGSARIALVVFFVLGAAGAVADVGAETDALSAAAGLGGAAGVGEVGEAASALPAWAIAAFESLRGVPPLLYFGALVVATFVPIPVGPFYMAAGVLYGVGPALAWIAAALALSNLILHAAGRTFLRPRLEPFIVRRGYRIPRFDSPLDEALFIAFIRVTPGIPYFLQNLILAVAQLDLMRFLVLSVGLHMIFVTGFVVLGRSALEGELGWALGALAALIAFAALARIFAKRRTAVQ